MVCRSFRTDDQIDGPGGASLQFGRVLPDMGGQMRTVVAVAIHIAMDRAGSADLPLPLRQGLAGSVSIAKPLMRPSPRA